MNSMFPERMLLYSVGILTMLVSTTHVLNKRQLKLSGKLYPVSVSSVNYCKNTAIHYRSAHAPEE